MADFDYLNSETHKAIEHGMLLMKNEKGLFKGKQAALDKIDRRIETLFNLDKKLYLEALKNE